MTHRPSNCDDGGTGGPPSGGTGLLRIVQYWPVAALAFGGALNLAWVALLGWSAGRGLGAW